jgi:Glycosyl hydrolases family 43
MKTNKIIQQFILCILCCLIQQYLFAQINVEKQTIQSGLVWNDTKGEIINAHGGGVIYANGTYYWFGEKRGRSASEGVNVYSSKDLYKWNYEGLALAQDQNDTLSDIARGCVMERPKVLYNEKTGKYVMYFHLELRGQGYRAARAGVAVSDKVTGPYTFVSSFRPNGNMSRDMTLYKDDDGSAYLMYSSRENYDLRLVKLSDDFLNVTTQDQLLFANHREAPAVLKYKGKYHLITSGCTGWDPNKASLHIASSMWGPWVESNINPMKGENANKTFNGQSTYILPIQGKKDAFVFLADQWNPKNLKDSRYLWLPVQFENGLPIVEWLPEWKLDFFNK